MWVEAVGLEELRSSGRKLVRHGKRQIVLFAVNDEFRAVDNRCPHEGYPLLQGRLDSESCQLTCRWHNWKFDLSSGEVVGGGDTVGIYPTRVEGGRVYLEVKELSVDAVQTKVLADLRRAVADRDYTRIAREVSRLLVHGIDPRVAVTETIAATHDKREWGTTHAFAATTDWLRLYEQVSDREQKIVCLAESLDHMAYDALRHPAYPYPTDESEFEGDSFLRAVEAQDEPSAIGLLRGGLRAGLGWQELEYWYAKAALAHYNDYGHAAIYVAKTGQLLDSIGIGSTEALLLPLTRMLCNTTREDLLPEFRRYAEVLAKIAPSGGTSERELDGMEVMGKTIRQTMDWLIDRSRTHRPGVVYAALLEASAIHLLHFEDRHAQAASRSVTQNVNWLGFTHAFTFGNAARGLSETYPELWPATLLQMACFVGRLKRFLDPDASTGEWLVTDREAFLEETRAIVLDHDYSDPIYSAHLIKTYLAVKEELDFVSQSGARHLTAALNRFFHAKIKEKHPLRAARQSLALVGSEA